MQNDKKDEKGECDMPLPLIIGGIAAVAGVAGIGSGIFGGIKMKEADDAMRAAQRGRKMRSIDLNPEMRK